MTGYTAVARGPETDALLAVLAAGLPVGDGIKPDNGGFPGGDSTAQFVPYAVLHSGLLADVSGPVADPFADTSAEYQVTSVGETAGQARAVADKARGLIFAAPLVVPGRHVQLVRWVHSLPAQRDDDVIPPLFYAIDLYAIDSAPA